MNLKLICNFNPYILFNRYSILMTRVFLLYLILCNTMRTYATQCHNFQLFLMESGTQKQGVKLCDVSSSDTSQFWMITQVRAERSSQGARDIQFSL